MNLKSERLKKFEHELSDLEQWLRLGLVPKKDVIKHKEEIESVKKKIEDETNRLRFLKESGEMEEYVPPKRSARPAYQEPQSMPEMAVVDAEEESVTENGSNEEETESFDTESSTEEETTTKETAIEDTHSQIYDEEDDPFSDKNRWKRGILEDPDADEW